MTVSSISPKYIDPLRVKEALQVEPEVRQSTAEGAKEHDKEYTFVLQKDDFGTVMSFTIDTSNPKSLGMIIQPTDEVGSVIAFYGITKVVYNPKLYKVIFENFNSNTYSVLEIYSENGKGWWDLKVGIDKEQYEKKFKNY